MAFKNLQRYKIINILSKKFLTIIILTKCQFFPLSPFDKILSHWCHKWIDEFFLFDRFREIVSGIMSGNTGKLTGMKLMVAGSGLEPLTSAL